MMLNTLNQKLILNGIPDSIITSENSDLLAKHFENLLYDDLQALMNDTTKETNREISKNELSNSNTAQALIKERENK